MCASCGCNQPNEGHGNNANITGEQIQAAAKAAGISNRQAAENMVAATSSMT